jgi:hypothetical protein
MGRAGLCCVQDCWGVERRGSLEERGCVKRREEVLEVSLGVGDVYLGYHVWRTDTLMETEMRLMDVLDDGKDRYTGVWE